MNKLSRWKERAWRRDPRCHWCGVRTVLLLKHVRYQFANLATVDHLRDRYDPARREPNTENAVRRVLACWACNHGRGEARTTARPIEELHERAGRHPLDAAPTLEA